MEGGSTMEDAVEAAIVFQDAGVDMLSISGGMCGYTNPLDDGPGYFSKESKAIKSSVNIPIILTGGIKNLKDAEKLLEYETCDMIGVGRTALDDFDWARRAIAALKR
jgi:2,4-dienoyl-CoA reductase-like NADH-dependent reductase (Old Yellow Enzyme family)